MPNPWDVPPPAPSGDDNPDDIFRAVGDALSAWESAEHRIATIFMLLVAENVPEPPLPDYGPAVRAYGSVISFQARAAMVEAAAESFFHIYPHPEFKSRLKKLMKSANGWAARRNDLAHGGVGGFNPNLNQCVLWPGDYNSRKMSVDNRAAYMYNSNQIMAFQKSFYDLSTDLGNYFVEFWQWRRGSPE